MENVTDDNLAPMHQCDLARGAIRRAVSRINPTPG